MMHSAEEDNEDEAKEGDKEAMGAKAGTVKAVGSVAKANTVLEKLLLLLLLLLALWLFLPSLARLARLFFFFFFFVLLEAAMFGYTQSLTSSSHQQELG
jgi:hypothetical protein